MEITTIKGKFRIIDFSISHKILLLRTSTISEINGEIIVNNTDIFFAPTAYMELPTYFTDIKLYLGEELDWEYIQNKIPDLISPFHKLFVIMTNDVKYYVLASRVEIQTNNLPPLETSIGLKR